MRLVYKHNHEHHFKIITYPDGQYNVELDMNYFNNVKEPIEIICSIRNFSELEIFLALIAALHKHDFIVRLIDFKYMFGMRSDRSFALGQPNYFRDVLAPILNNLRPRLSFYYPHSEIAMRALNYGSGFSHAKITYEPNCFVIGADQNSLWCDLLALTDTPHFLKKRTPEGIDIYLPSHAVKQIEELPDHMPLLIKDDLCDGGATFIAIAEYLQMHFPERKRYLFVAHGLFTKGVNHVLQHWDKVITTNSYQEFPQNPNDPLHIPKDKFEVIDVWK